MGTAVNAQQLDVGGPIQKLSTFFKKPEIAEQFEEALPAGTDANTVHALRNQFFNAIRGNDDLCACSMESLVDCFYQSALMNLKVGSGPLSHAHMIPRGGQACFQVGAGGYRELIRRANKGELLEDYICEGDTFKNHGRFKLPEHVPSNSNTRRFDKCIGAWCAFIPKDGGLPRVSYWTREELIKHRDLYAEGYKRCPAAKKSGNPWHTGKAEDGSDDHAAFRHMAVKTAVLDLVNRRQVPLATEDQEALLQAALSVDMQPEEQLRALAKARMTQLAKKSGTSLVPVDENPLNEEPAPANPVVDPGEVGNGFELDREFIYSEVANTADPIELGQLQEHLTELAGGDDELLTIIRNACQGRNAEFENADNVEKS